LYEYIVLGAKIRVRSTVLGAFPKLRKANNSFVVSVHPSVHVEQIGSHWTDFHKVLSIFGKSVGKIQFLLKCDKNNGYFTWSPIHIFDHISLISY